ncbi:processed acidic surface protein [Salipaludibacillus sp. HK11]|uniref:processed acidic surface protein n=1 Tax=Salipaludibacillus sp. HK11 TaxID=3394320 RepID=UPI0039FD877E
MKGLFIALLVSIFFVSFPSAGNAAPKEKEVNSFLQEINWEKNDLIEYLDFYGWKVKDFNDIDELRDFCGPVLTVKNLNELLEEYELTLEEATNLLVEYGLIEVGETIFDQYKFLDDLDWDLYDYYYYPSTPLSQDGIDKLLIEYNLTYEELLSLLAEFDDSLDNYEYVEDLDFAIWVYLYSDEDYFEFSDEDFDDIFNQVGLTIDELERLFEHFMMLDYDDAFMDKLEALANRMIAFEDFNGASELTAKQVAELLDIFSELMALLEMDAKFYLVKGEEQVAISLDALFKMTTSEGYDLLIELYNKQGDFLADILITADMLGSELIIETGMDLKKTEDILEQKETKVSDVEKVVPPSKSDSGSITKTEHGAKLPKTASNYMTDIAFGLSITLFGFFFYRKFRLKSV